MTRTRADRAKVHALTARYNLIAVWNRLGWFGQILVGSVLYATFLLVAVPQFARLVERAMGWPS